MKKLSLILAAVLCLSMCACGAKDKGNSSTTSTNDGEITATTAGGEETTGTGTGTSTGSTSTTTKAKVTKGSAVGTATRTTVAQDKIITGNIDNKAFNFNGTITFLAGWDLTPTGDSELGKQMLKSIERVKKKYNVNFKYTTQDIDELPSMMVASAMSKEVLADIVVLRATQAYPYMVSAGLLKKLDNFIHDEYKMYSQSSINIASVDGSIYGYGLGKGSTGNFVYYNKTMFKKNNWKTPAEYYKEGKWTWENFAKVCEAVKNTSGGKIWGSGMLDYGKIDLIMPTFGGDFMKYEKGKYTSTLVSQSNIDALTYINRITYVSKICQPRPEGASWDYDIWKFCAGNYAMMISDSSSLYKVNKNLSDEFSIVPLPYGGTRKTHISTANNTNCYLMPATVSDDRAKKIFTILEDMYSPYNQADDLLYEESPYLYDEESQQVLNKLPDIQYVTTVRGLNEYYTLLLPALVEGVQKDGNAAAALQSVNSGWQKALEDSLNSYYK